MSQYTPTKRYRVLVVILCPLLIIYTVWRALKDGGKRYFLQRLGFGYGTSNTTATSPPTLWIHAASVGEVFTVLPLIQRIKRPLLVTTMSPTGAFVLHQQQLPHVKHVYLPLDFPGACKRFIKHMNISEGWIVETEIWPWLYSTAYAKSVPLTIINARLSKRTSDQSNGLLATTYASALAAVRILARSAQDAVGFANLGACTTKISVVGDLKYAKPDDAYSTSSAHKPLLTRRFVLAASTHDSEEIQLAQQWSRQLAATNQDALLVIVPRHPERGAAIVRDLTDAGIDAALRSQTSAIPASCQIYVADTLGELQAWYSQATACFVGGSLITRGGHNMLEPARANCPIVVGHHTFNFNDIVDSMIAAQAIVIAKDAQEVVLFLIDAFNDKEAYRPMTQRAGEQARRFESIVDAYLEKLQPE